MTRIQKLAYQIGRRSKRFRLWYFRRTSLYMWGIVRGMREIPQDTEIKGGDTWTLWDLPTKEDTLEDA